MKKMIDQTRGVVHRVWKISKSGWINFSPLIYPWMGSDTHEEGTTQKARVIEWFMVELSLENFQIWASRD